MPSAAGATLTGQRLAMSAMGQKQTLPDISAISALPPKADIAERECHVRFVPKADSCTAANSIAISITSSARESSEGGTVRPSALAVFRLMTSSYLVGACT